MTNCDNAPLPIPEKVDRLLRQVVAWAAEAGEVRAVVLVGSYARGQAGDDSDVDLVLLVDDPGRLTEDDRWPARFGPVERLRTELWGKVYAIRVWYADRPEVEFALAPADWARLPLDPGTARVLRDGFRSLYDPQHLLAQISARSLTGLV
ncbi:MAG TPA: nucleotidyltransferase domain-containing protein [Anaerolineales bacterium]|nr:nucleotidyltransferase domain-containing protein [Anaerolineales bacterium]